MRADDIMTMDVVTVSPDADVHEVANKLFHYNVSGLPVVDEKGRILGIISEGDLMRRPEMGTERHSSWWQGFHSNSKKKAEEYVRTHSHHVADVMTRKVITVSENTPVAKIAELLETHRIKRVPVVRKGKLVGIVSRANLLHGLIIQKPAKEPRPSDSNIKKAMAKEIQKTGVRANSIDIDVSDGVVHLSGTVQLDVEKHALFIAAENVDGVSTVVDHVSVMPQLIRATVGGE